jgi:hypothetical protein
LVEVKSSLHVIVEYPLLGVNMPCLVAWVGFFVLTTALNALGALLGRRTFDLAFIAESWALFVVVPFGLAWLLRWLHRDSPAG